MSKKNKELKLVLLGQSNVGKTSLFMRILRDEFPDDCETTIGASYCILYIVEFDDKSIQITNPSQFSSLPASATIWKVNTWDTAGQERYKSLVPMYYRGADIAVLVHDNTPDSLHEIKRIAKELRTTWKKDDCITSICQNKCDVINTVHNLDVVEDCKVDHYGLVSALSGANVKSYFISVCQAYLQTLHKIKEDALLTPVIHVQPTTSQKYSYQQCCSTNMFKF